MPLWLAFSGSSAAVRPVQRPPNSTLEIRRLTFELLLTPSKPLDTTARKHGKTPPIQPTSQMTMNIKMRMIKIWVIIRYKELLN